MIDAHVHLGRIRSKSRGLSASDLLPWMDRNDIDRAVVMAVEAPEEKGYVVTTRAILGMTKQHRDRLLPMCALDPERCKPDTYSVLKVYVDEGCIGYGENLCGLPVDAPMQQRVYEACDRLGLALVMHFGVTMNTDSIGLPAFERMLTRYPNIKFVGHGPIFWREISADMPLNVFYPNGKVKPGGRLDELFGRYSNLYADLSALSGYNAITRDEPFGLAFLTRWSDRLLFGTDYAHPKQRMRIIDFFRKVDLSDETVEKITKRNAMNIFRLEN